MATVFVPKRCESRGNVESRGLNNKRLFCSDCNISMFILKNSTNKKSTNAKYEIYYSFSSESLFGNSDILALVFRFK